MPSSETESVSNKLLGNFKKDLTYIHPPLDEPLHDVVSNYQVEMKKAQTIQKDTKPSIQTTYQPFMNNRDDPQFQQLLDAEAQKAAMKFAQRYHNVKNNDIMLSQTTIIQYKHRSDSQFQQLLDDEAQRVSVEFAQLFSEINGNDDKESKMMTWRDLEKEKLQSQEIQLPGMR